MRVGHAFLMLMLVLGWSIPARAQPFWEALHGYVPGVTALAESNGQKLVTGPGPVLHLVWAKFGTIEYSQSTDGQTWSTAIPLACGLTGRLPAIAADTSGKLVVVWVDDATHSIQYVFHGGSNGTWSMPETIVTDGDEPTIAARGGKAYLAWRPTDADRIEYAKFAIGAAPALDIETIEQAGCPEDQFRLPSIALVAAADPCADPVPVVAYSFSRTAPCLLAGSIIGPRVCRRDNALGTWNLTWIGDQTLDSLSTDVQPFSISLASRYRTRELFLAYSLLQGDATRTAMAHASQWNWSGPEPIDTQKRHIHVRANEANSASLGTFRVARSPLDPEGAEYRDGVWTGASPAWTTPWTESEFYSAGRPHATWWNGCSQGNARWLFFVAEEDLVVGSGGTSVGVAYTLEPCPPSSPPILYKQPCRTPAVRVAGFVPPGGSRVTLVDVTEAGNVTSFDDKGAVVTAATGGKITVSWGPGKVVASSESTLTITASPDSVRFSSTTERITVESLGTLHGFDRAPGGERCLGR